MTQIRLTQHVNDLLNNQKYKFLLDRRRRRRASSVRLSCAPSCAILLGGSETRPKIKFIQV